MSCEASRTAMTPTPLPRRVHHALPMSRSAPPAADPPRAVPEFRGGLGAHLGVPRSSPPPADRPIALVRAWSPPVQSLALNAPSSAASAVAVMAFGLTLIALVAAAVSPLALTLVGGASLAVAVGMFTAASSERPVVIMNVHVGEPPARRSTLDMS